MNLGEGGKLPEGKEEWKQKMNTRKQKVIIKRLWLMVTKCRTLVEDKRNG